MILASCEKEGGEQKHKVSRHQSDESHNAGQNCISCHKEGGGGEGWFTAAATVYDSSFAQVYPNATIKLYSGPNGTGTLKHVIEVDAKGNFYTTEALDFGTGLYPAVEGATGTNYMSFSITTGECASCHGVSTNKIWAR